ncbi:MAG: cyclic nucleotide-binding domain-containing protein [Deltaproteobacteria bacterium]|nr:cyclic nucleotide-binding domain-containing protein [Deltaproteobacteria bacterium]
MNIEVKDVMAGAKVIEAGEHRLGLGFPEEIVKAWMKSGAQVNGWIIPDVRTAHGIVQWALEFPLYHALFVRGTFGRGEKMPVIVERSQWKDVVEYLRLTLLGLSRDEMRGAGVKAEIAEMLAKESDYLALKKKDGSVAPIEEFLEPVFYDTEGVAKLGELSVKRHGDNVYSFFTASDRIDELRLEVPAGQTPTYSLAPATRPVTPEPFELIMLGASNGFDAKNPCSNQVVQANGRFVLIDAGPYVRQTLNHAGIGLNQLSGLVITHAHEDHAVGLSALLETRQKLRLFISRENAEIMRKKLAILNADVNKPERLLDDAFEITYVEPGKDYDFCGLRLRYHYTFHSIPCTGVELSVTSGGATKKALIVGDSDSRAHIEAAFEKGAISGERYADLLMLYEWRGDLIVADAGEGAIHGAPIDFVNNESNVVYVHTGALKEAALYTLGRAGYRYTIASDHLRLTALERGLGLRALTQAFKSVSLDALNVLLDAATAENVNAGHVIMRQGELGRDVIVALTGELSVLLAQADGSAKPVAAITAGEICGERAAVSGAPRSATVVASTAARLMRIPAAVFERFSESEALASVLPEIWERRGALDRVRLLDGASVTAKQLLAEHAVKKTIEAGATLIREKSQSSTVFVLVAGRVQVYKGTDPLLVAGAPVIVESGTLIGETAPFLNKERNASIVTLDECEVLAIRGADFKRIVESSPQLFCHISRTVKQRAA